MQPVVQHIGQWCYQPVCDPIGARIGFSRGVSDIISPLDALAISTMKIQASAVLARLIAHNAVDLPDEDTRLPSGLLLTPGDGIGRPGALGVRSCMHYSLYIGEGFVVEVGGRPSSPLETLQGVASCMRAVSPQHVGVETGVVLIPLRDFLSRTRECVVLDFPAGTRRTRQKSIELAIESIGMWNYHLFRSNCEHFVNWLVCGQFHSSQVVDYSRHDLIHVPDIHGPISCTSRIQSTHPNSVTLSYLLV